ncbi:hypothetical protein [Mariniphaga sediminis]|uniref:hypothetical protein n=1 Tax=Mariniphaga sediminis TaxID=1628158 RepID=UPI003563F9D2
MYKLPFTEVNDLWNTELRVLPHHIYKLPYFTNEIKSLLVTTKMDKITNTSNQNLNRAYRIIDELRIYETWENLNSTCNLVGSVKTGLLMNHLDIDFHTYSKKFSIEKSFNAIAEISKNPKIKEVIYKNLLDKEDMCLEWHLLYEEKPERIWTIDIIHIKNESPYAGMIERVTDKISAVLSEPLKKKILNIKWESEQGTEKIPGIEIYQAVIDDGVETFEAFEIWRKNRQHAEISLWEPTL